MMLPRHLTPPDPVEESEPTRSRIKRLFNYYELIQTCGYPLPRHKKKRSRGRPSRGYTLRNPVSAAIGLLSEHPDWKTKQIADAIECDPAVLSRSERWQKALEARASGRFDMDRGTEHKSVKYHTGVVEVEPDWLVKQRKRRIDRKPRGEGDED